MRGNDPLVTLQLFLWIRMALINFCLQTQAVVLVLPNQVTVQ